MIPTQSRPLRRLATAALVMSSILPAASCADDEADGNLSIRYQLGGRSPSCEMDGVRDIRVRLDDAVDETTPCDVSNPFELSGIPARNYRRLVVEGLDADGIVTRDNLANERGVEVLAGRTNEVDVELTATPARVRFNFRIFKANGVPYAPQEQIPIRSFRVTAYENGGTGPLASYDFVLDALESFSEVPMADPGRDVVGDDVDTLAIDIVPIQQSDEQPTIRFEFEPPGAGQPITVFVECNGVACAADIMLPTTSMELPGSETGGTDGGTETNGSETDDGIERTDTGDADTSTGADADTGDSTTAPETTSDTDS